MRLPRRWLWGCAGAVVLLFVAILILATSWRWALGTWVCTTPGVTGELTVEKCRESSTFRLSLDGETGPLLWQGTARWTGREVTLRVFTENRRVRDEPIDVSLSHVEDGLEGEIRRVPVRFERR